MTNLELYMDVAIEEAKKSLKEGNSGFGAVIIKDGDLISKAHDTDKTSNDPTAHAEITAIRLAAEKSNGDFSGCVLVSTHEPCPMCSTAMIWAGIKKIAFGYSIRESLQQGRRRIDLSCMELFQRSKAVVEIVGGLKKEDCALLYNDRVRKSVKQLRKADSARLEQLEEDLAKKRADWIAGQNLSPVSDNCLDAAYRLFLEKLDITAEEAPVVERNKGRLVIHSKNFCPTLEACKILDLDTRVICKKLTEGPTNELLGRLNPKLRFKRNYGSIRPFTPYCEEMIILEDTPIHGELRADT
jgi:tRNA(Arg) A34 adenosine deaminase TadA